MPAFKPSFRPVTPSSGMKISLPHESFEVHGFTDDHVGANEHDRSVFASKIDAVRNTPNAYWFGNGDLLEFIPPAYKGMSQREQYKYPDDQFIEAAELLVPIANKCLFVRGGNHDSDRSTRLCDFDVMKILARTLDVPFVEGPGYAHITASKNNHKKNSMLLASGHGVSTAKNGDLELYKLKEVYSQADVFFLGHNHQLYAKPVDSLSFDGNGEHLRRQWFVRGGSSLRYSNYARKGVMSIQRTGWAVMRLDKDGIVRCEVMP